MSDPYCHGCVHLVTSKVTHEGFTMRTGLKHPYICSKYAYVFLHGRSCQSCLTLSRLPICMENDAKTTEDTAMQDTLTKEEKQILTIIRKTGYGEVSIKVRDGKPVLATESKTTKLD